MSFVLTPTSRLLLPNRRTFLFHRRNAAESFSFSTSSTLTCLNSPAGTRINSAQSCSNSSTDPVDRPENIPIFGLFIPLAFSLVLLCLRLFHGVLLPEFPRRWRELVVLSRAAESRMRAYPAHLWQAVVAYEDRRFFRHCGVDPIGIARAAVSFSARGGGSTITQQLVKNAFLKNERTLARKIVEMVLALALERTLSKWQILSSYLSEIYWGHGIYGIESASMFYFRKRPSLLCFGESTILAGMIPAPELRSPFRDPSRGVIFQVRVLKRMVKVGFIDVEMALETVKQPASLSDNGPKSADGSSNSFYSSKQGNIKSDKMKHGAMDLSIIGDIWDWEKESKIWEAREDMERWAAELQRSKQITESSSQTHTKRA
ncbi:uncharacterized protein LOC116203021 isoform X2 [Punica granatum]|uniref:Uncharacterized protein LOC116203021 isoform X2 n=1 Tax=Punica granatum TaxID=22663 RepID=A0A6P8D0E0_PUNGR|nr:uncharacterized protein LOC116203021 isoform X2 [Punica granatum]